MYPRINLPVLCLFVFVSGCAYAQGPEAGAGLTITPQQFGATGNGQTDDTNAIQSAINALPSGATLNFGDASKTYLISRMLILKPSAAYAGEATIRLRSSASLGTVMAALMSGGSDDVTVTGLTFDANKVGEGLALGVQGSDGTPVRNVSIVNVTFRNTLATATGNTGAALYDPSGLENATISGNTFLQCGSGISIANADNVTIANNTFTNITAGDAIFLVFKDKSWQYGEGIQITGNRGQSLTRMAIELWASGPTKVKTPLIANNTFSNWTPQAGGTFGISVMTGTGAQLTGNVISAGITGPRFGLEIGAPSSQISQNTITGFDIGIVLHDCHDSTVAGNMLASQLDTGIQVTNAPGSKENLTIHSNNIWYPKQFGIMINDSDWGGSSVLWNNIMRAAGEYSDDNNLFFQGIASTPPNSPVTVSHNLVFQFGQNPPPGFRFAGIRLNGFSGANASSVYDSNTVISTGTLSNTIGLYAGSPGSADGVTVSNTLFELLNSVSGGATSPGVLKKNNKVVNCLLQGPIQLTQ